MGFKFDSVVQDRGLPVLFFGGSKYALFLGPDCLANTAVGDFHLPGDVAYSQALASELDNPFLYIDCYRARGIRISSRAFEFQIVTDGHSKHEQTAFPRSPNYARHCSHAPVRAFTGWLFE